MNRFLASLQTIKTFLGIHKKAALLYAVLMLVGVGSFLYIRTYRLPTNIPLEPAHSEELKEITYKQCEAYLSPEEISYENPGGFECYFFNEFVRSGKVKNSKKLVAFYQGNVAGFAKDDTNVYVLDYRSEEGTSRVTVLEGADPNTFTVYSKKEHTGYAQDKDSIYYYTKRLSVDRATFTVLKYSFATDKDHIYQGGEILPLTKEERELFLQLVSKPMAYVPFASPIQPAASIRLSNSGKTIPHFDYNIPLAWYTVVTDRNEPIGIISAKDGFAYRYVYPTRDSSTFILLNDSRSTYGVLHTSTNTFTLGTLGQNPECNNDDGSVVNSTYFYDPLKKGLVNIAQQTHDCGLTQIVEIDVLANTSEIVYTLPEKAFFYSPNMTFSADGQDGLFTIVQYESDQNKSDLPLEIHTTLLWRRADNSFRKVAEGDIGIVLVDSIKKHYWYYYPCYKDWCSWGPFTAVSYDVATPTVLISPDYTALDVGTQVLNDEMSYPLRITPDGKNIISVESGPGALNSCADLGPPLSKNQLVRYDVSSGARHVIATAPEGLMYQLADWAGENSIWVELYKPVMTTMGADYTCWHEKTFVKEELIPFR